MSVSQFIALDLTIPSTFTDSVTRSLVTIKNTETSIYSVYLVLRNRVPSGGIFDERLNLIYCVISVCSLFAMLSVWDEKSRDKTLVTNWQRLSWSSSIEQGSFAALWGFINQGLSVVSHVLKMMVLCFLLAQAICILCHPVTCNKYCLVVFIAEHRDSQTRSSLLTFK